MLFRPAAALPASLLTPPVVELPVDEPTVLPEGPPAALRGREAGLLLSSFGDARRARTRNDAE